MWLFAFSGDCTGGRIPVLLGNEDLQDGKCKPIYCGEIKIFCLKETELLMEQSQNPVQVLTYPERENVSSKVSREMKQRRKDIQEARLVPLCLILRGGENTLPL